MILSPCTPVPPALLQILTGSFPGPFTWVQCPHSYSPPPVLCIQGPRRKPSCLQFRRSLRARPHFQTHPGTDCEQSCWHRDPPGHTHVCTSGDPEISLYLALAPAVLVRKQSSPPRGPMGDNLICASRARLWTYLGYGI